MDSELSERNFRFSQHDDEDQDIHDGNGNNEEDDDDDEEYGDEQSRHIANRLRQGQVVTDIIGISTMMMKTVHWIMKRVMEMTKKEKMRRLTLLKTYCLEDLLGESSNSLMMMI
jgi:hypothetical protein